MKLLTTAPGRFRLDSCSNAIYALSQQIPGMVYVKGTATDQRHFALSRDAAELLARAWGERGLMGDFTALRQAHLTSTAPIMLDTPLRDYQRTGVQFLLDRGEEGCILADAMRLGKTAQALSAARAVGGRTIVVCPSYVRGVWKEQAARWWPDAVPFFPTGRTAAPIPADATLVVIHYDIVAAWEMQLGLWNTTTFVIDEAHWLSNEKTARAKAVKALAVPACFRWALTGTPLTNRPKDLWNVVDTVSLGRFGSFFSYGILYCAGHQREVPGRGAVWDFDGRSNESELAGRLRHFMLRRTPTDPSVALELPKKTRNVIWLAAPGAKGRGASLAVSLGGTSPTALRAMLDRSADAKLPLVWEGLRDRLESGQKVVVFCHRRAVAEKLAEEAGAARYGAFVVHGGRSTAARAAALQGAENAPGAALLATTIDTCSTGIDLSWADGAVFAELTYEPHELLQAEARPVAYGDKAKPTFIDYFLLRGSIDEVVAETVIGKLDTLAAVVGDSGEGLGGELRGNVEDSATAFARAVEEWCGE